MLDRVARRQFVEIPGAGHLGREDRAKALRCLLHERAVVEDHRGVNHAAKRWHRGADSVQRPFDVRFATHVPLREDHPGSLPLHARDRGGGFG